MVNSRLLKILFPIDIKSLTIRERIYHILIFTVPLLLFAIVMATTPSGWFTIVLWALYVVLFAPWWYCMFTYEFFSKFLASFAPGIMLAAITISYIMDEVFLGFVISFAFIIPSLALYFRDDVFNDESCIEGDDIILGYTPAWYGLLSVAIGLFGYINAFKLNNPTLAISLIIVTLIFQILAIAPDKLNKVLFFEVRRISGCLLLLFSLGAIFLLICSMIIAILFIRKIKSMNK